MFYHLYLYRIMLNMFSELIFFPKKNCPLCGVGLILSEILPNYIITIWLVLRCDLVQNDNADSAVYCIFAIVTIFLHCRHVGFLTPICCPLKKTFLRKYPQKGGEGVPQSIIVFFSVKGGGVVPGRDKHLQYLTTSLLIGNNMNWSPFAFCFHRGLKWCMLWRRYCNRFAIRSPRSGARPLVARFEVVRHDSSNLPELFF